MLCELRAFGVVIVGTQKYNKTRALAGVAKCLTNVDWLHMILWIALLVFVKKKGERGKRK